MKTAAFLFMLAIVTAFSCGRPEQVTMEELSQYVLKPENGLVRSVTKNGITLEIMYRPKDLVIAQEAGISDKAKWEQEKNRIDSLDYFVLKISRNGEEVLNKLAGDEERYNHAMNYLSSDIGSDLLLKIGEDVLEAEGFSFVPTFGASNATAVLVIFKSCLEKRSGNFTITWDDAMFGSGSTEFEFEASEIRNVPPLQTQF